MLPHRKLPAGFRRMQRALARRRRCAAAHLSVTASPCHLPSRGGLGARRLRGKAPLEGSWRGAPERCYRTESFPQGFGVCRGRLRAAAAARRHTSPSRFACHLPSRGGFGGASPEGCYRANRFPQGFGLCRGALPNSCVIIPQFPPKQKRPGQSAEIPGRAGGFLDFCRRSDIIKSNLPAARQPARRDRRNLKHAEKHRENHGKNRRPV